MHPHHHLMEHVHVDKKVEEEEEEAEGYGENIDEKKEAKRVPFPELKGRTEKERGWKEYLLN